MNEAIDLTAGVRMRGRRSFLSKASLSAVGVALLAGQDALAASQKGPKNDARADVGILNVALGLEHEGVNAYTLGAKSGLLQAPVLDIALRFQTDHKEHRDALIATILKLGGTPAPEKT